MTRFDLFLFAWGAAMPFFAEDQMSGVQSMDGVYTLAPGPRNEGLAVLLWSDKDYKTFHEVPWIDVASIRTRWASLEPKDQEFDWKTFDRGLAEVKKYNAEHPGAHRTLAIRVMGGEHIPPWFEEKGVKLYTTQTTGGHAELKTIRTSVPFDNPEFIKQLREVYRAMYERYKDEPLVTLYHGTWSAGPWDEVFIPYKNKGFSEPDGATPEKYIQGSIEQLDVLIDEFCLKGKAAELPYSGSFARDKKVFNFTGPLTDHIVKRLGKRSPFLYIQSNGWGCGKRDWYTVAWDHEQDIYDAYGKVNIALQAIGSNGGGNWVKGLCT